MILIEHKIGVREVIRHSLPWSAVAVPLSSPASWGKGHGGTIRSILACWPSWVLSVVSYVHHRLFCLVWTLLSISLVTLQRL